MSTEQKKVVLSVVKTIAKEEEPWWDDKNSLQKWTAGLQKWKVEK